MASCRLDIAELRVAACDAVIKRLSPDTCVDAWDLAETLALPPLTAAAKRVALTQFDEVTSASAAAFARLPAARLELLLADDELAIKEEESAFRALEQWYDAQASPSPSDASEGLLSQIRFPLIQDPDFRRALERSPIVLRHPMVLVTAYREAANREQTARNRKRKFMLPRPVTYEELEVGMEVQIMADKAFVQARCEERAPGAGEDVGWDEEMDAAVGKTFHIVELDGDTQAAVLDTDGKFGMMRNFNFPFTALLA